VRFIGLDVHLDFCEIAICEAGRVRSGGRVPTSPQGLAILANSLARDDQVALEATGNALAIARTLEPHVARVVVATRTELRAITEAKVKTDRRDARTLARLLAAGLLRGCWLPDEQTRALRRRPGPPGAVGASAHALQERGPRGVDAHAQGAPADERRLRARRPRLAGRA
jgi:transposase